MDELIRTGLLLAALAAPPAAGSPQSAAALRLEAPSVVTQYRDPWLGRDKFQHFWVSFAATSFAFAAATSAGQDTDAALTISIPLAAAAGVGKELHDRRAGTFFSARDLVADALGIAAAFVLLREVR
jgi:putative lipoprotein